MKLFILLNLLDFLSTWFALSVSRGDLEEANPFIRPFYLMMGVCGLLLIKIVLVLGAIGFAELIRRSYWFLTEGFYIVSTAILTWAVINNVYLGLKYV